MKNLLKATPAAVGILISLAVLSSCQAQTENLDILVLKNQFALNDKLFNNVLDDIDENEAIERVGDANSIKWIAGHTLDAGYNIAAIVGLELNNPYADQFGFGKPFEPSANYPSLEQMKDDWISLAPQVERALAGLTLEQVNEPSPFPIPYNEQTIRGLLAFQMHHLGYEIGQLGLYRRILGKSAMSYQ